MPAQYVNIQGGGDADWSQLLNQTQTQAAREHEVAKRMAAQRALLQQMADRGEIKVPDNQVSVGRGGMEFNTEAARKAWVQSQNPDRKDLTNDAVNTSDAKVLQTAGDVIKETDVAAIHEQANPNFNRMSQLALEQAEIAAAVSRQRAADPNSAWARGQLEGGLPPAPDPKPGQQAAVDALGQIMGMNKPPAAAQPPATPIPLAPSTTPTTTAPATTAPPAGKAGNGGSQAMQRSGRDTMEGSSTPVNFSLKAEPMIETRSTKSGYSLRDEVQETLPSLRKAAAIESISAMFGGTNVQSPGRFNALAEQRERDLASVNAQLGTNGTVTSITGGKVDVSTSGGQSSYKVADAAAGSNNMTFNNNASMGGSGSTARPKAGIGTFQGVGGANVEGNWTNRGGEDFISGVKGALATFGIPEGLDGTGVLGEFNLRAENLRDAKYNVVIDSKNEGRDGKQSSRAIKWNGKKIGTLKWDAVDGWTVNPDTGASVPARVWAELTGNEFNTDGTGRTELGTAQAIARKPKGNQ